MKETESVGNETGHGLLYTMPVTQVSVERMFSALKLYKTDLRSRLKDDILNAMMILKANM